MCHLEDVCLIHFGKKKENWPMPWERKLCGFSLFRTRNRIVEDCVPRKGILGRKQRQKEIAGKRMCSIRYMAIVNVWAMASALGRFLGMRQKIDFSVNFVHCSGEMECQFKEKKFVNFFEKFIKQKYFKKFK